MDPLDFDAELQTLKERSIDRLLMADICDRRAFEVLLDGLEARAVKLKSLHVLPKQFLSCLRGASEAITSRAEYLPDARDALDLGRRFDLLLDLAIRGESLADRARGAPRVV